MDEQFDNSLEEIDSFRLKDIITSEALTKNAYNRFQERVSNPSMVKQDILNVWKEYEQWGWGQEYVIMKLLSLLADYKKNLWPVDSWFFDFHLKQFLSLVYPELKNKTYKCIDYLEKKVAFFREHFLPIYQKNQEIIKNNTEVKKIEKQINEHSRNIVVQ